MCKRQTACGIRVINGKEGILVEWERESNRAITVFCNKFKGYPFLQEYTTERHRGRK